MCLARADRARSLFGLQEAQAGQSPAMPAVPAWSSRRREVWQVVRKSGQPGTHFSASWRGETVTLNA